MKLKTKILILMGSLLLVVFAVNIAVAPTVSAGNGKLDVRDMNDRFATEKTGANGLAKVRATQEGSIEVERVIARSLIPDHLYKVKVTVDLTTVFDTASIMSDKHGRLVVNDFDLGAFAPGVYRLDIFVTHPHPAGTGTAGDGEFIAGLLGSEALLACQPAFTVTVE